MSLYFLHSKLTKEAGRLPKLPRVPKTILPEEYDDALNRWYSLRSLYHSKSNNGKLLRDIKLDNAIKSKATNVLSAKGSIGGTSTALKNLSTDLANFFNTNIHDPLRRSLPSDLSQFINKSDIKKTYNLLLDRINSKSYKQLMDSTTDLD